VDDDASDMAAEEDEGGGGAPGWMVTFGDMMSLLLTFFVLLLSYSTMDITKFQMVLKSIRVGFGEMSTTAIVEPTTPQFGSETEKESSTDEESNFLAMKLEEVIDQADVSSAVELTREEAGILLRIRGNIVFTPGSAEFRPESFQFLREIGGLLREFPHHVLVKGHTDDSPLPTGSQFPSNWELSAARASAVVRYLVDQSGLAPTRFAAVGFGDTRPIVENDGPEGRARNRRVEFLLVNQELGQAKDGVTLF